MASNVGLPVKSLASEESRKRKYYRWYPQRTRFMAHAEQSAQSTVVAEGEGKADPDGPILRQSLNAARETEYELPPAAVVVIRGKVAGR
jgi:hypothetical protein